MSSRTLWALLCLIVAVPLIAVGGFLVWCALQYRKESTVGTYTQDGITINYRVLRL